jgi:KDO2-lipid IV(A) lauroyltransferase
VSASPIRHRLEYAAVSTVRGLVARLPVGAVLAAGTVLGHAFYYVDAPHRRLTLANLAAAFPHRSRAEVRRHARGVFAHFGRLLVEVLRFSTLDHDAIRSAVEVEGGERVAQAHALGRGVLYVTGHFGFWEIHALAHGLTMPRLAVVARPLDNPLLHDLLERVRTSTGNTVVYRKGGLRRILRALSENQGVAVLIDQHIQAADAVVIDFFDRPAATTSAVAALALRTGAPVVPVFALPLGGGRYRLIYEHPVEPPAEGTPHALREFTQRCTDVLEMYVRRYPDLWLWMHRRWRDLEELPAPPMFPPGADEQNGLDEGP